MGFEFAETMSGTVEWDDDPGKQHPFKFEVTAHASSTRGYFFNGGRAQFRGVIHAPPRAECADTEGAITNRSIHQRIIRYELWFLGDDGKRYEMVGEKNLSWRNAVETMTTLPAEIRDENGKRVGTCVTRFDYKNDWWSFLRSFRST